nr:hypothetical protein [Candidatus Desulforudis audaxviator]
MADQGGKGGGDQQDVDEGIGELVQEDLKRFEPLLGFQGVRADRTQAFSRFFFGKALGAGI